MLSKRNRLGTKQFDEIMEKGRIIHSPFFLLRVFKTEKRTGVAAVAPKKVAKTAVSRNKLRRKIYSAARPLYKTLQAGVNLIIIAKPAVLEASQQEIVSDIEKLFIKAALLKK
jgi:ribonuclease P protein component